MKNKEARTLVGSYDKIANLHIVFWLLKDIAWCMVWKPLGIAMIVPTLAIAVLIAWRTRHVASERAFNWAITCWIVANAYWMVSEFFCFDDFPLWGVVEGKHLALLPFTAGLSVIAWHYASQKSVPAEKRPAL